MNIKKQTTYVPIEYLVTRVIACENNVASNSLKKWSLLRGHAEADPDQEFYPTIPLLSRSFLHPCSHLHKEKAFEPVSLVINVTTPISCVTRLTLTSRHKLVFDRATDSEGPLERAMS